MLDNENPQQHTTASPASVTPGTVRERGQDDHDDEGLQQSRSQSQSQSQPVSRQDIDTLTDLAQIYENVLEKKQLEIVASFYSIRQTAWAAAAYLIFLFTLGTAFVKHKAGVSLADAILFSAYTFTSAGYGNVDVPNTVPFLGFVVFYVFAGTSALAVLVAQTFQYLELITARWRRAREKANSAAIGQDNLQAIIRNASFRSVQNLSNQPLQPNQQPPSTTIAIAEQKLRTGLIESLKLVPHQPKKSSFQRLTGTNMPNPLLSFFCAAPGLTFLIVVLLVGTFTMMGLEGWTFVQALYFSTFTMTTVGYGDLFPTSQTSTWFCNFWLPLNVAFLAVYLSTVAQYYVRFAIWNTNRIEKQIKQKLYNSSTTSNQKHTHQHDAQQTNEQKNSKDVTVVKMQPSRPRTEFYGLDREFVLSSLPSGNESSSGKATPSNAQSSSSRHDSANDSCKSSTGSKSLFQKAKRLTMADRRDLEAGIIMNNPTDDEISATSASVEDLDNESIASESKPKNDTDSQTHKTNISKSMSAPSQNGNYSATTDDVNMMKSHPSKTSRKSKSASTQPESNSKDGEPVPGILTILAAIGDPTQGYSEQNTQGPKRKQRLRQLSDSGIAALLSRTGGEQLLSPPKGRQRRQRLRQLSDWSREKNPFFKSDLDESHDIGTSTEAETGIATTWDLLAQLSLTEATGAALLASSKQEDGQQDADPGLLKIRVIFKVMERLARIVAAEATNVQSEMEINGSVVSVTMDRLKDIADHWMIPNQARESFRVVLMSGIIFVGEREIALHGVDAFFRLNPVQFHSIFGPYVAAIEDTDTMIGWLVSTQSLRDQLIHSPPAESGVSFRARTGVRSRHFLKNKIEVYFPPNPGNAVLCQR